MPAVRDTQTPSVHVEELPSGVQPVAPPDFRMPHTPSRDLLEFAWTRPAPVRLPWLRLPWWRVVADENRPCVNCAQPYPCYGARRQTCQY